MSRYVNIIVAVGLLAIAALTGYGIVTAVNRAVAPAANAGNTLATTVAIVLPATPTPLPNGAAVVVAMRTLARLETAQFTIEKVIIKEDGQGALGALFGDRVIFVAHGDVLAGVDMAGLAQGDVTVMPGGVAFVTLPAAQVLVTTIDNDKSYVVDRQTGLLTKGNVNLETAARQEAQHEVEAAALEAGILDRAQSGAELYVRQLLATLGYTNVTITRATPAP
ncbi:MAG: DUF4230 domain-containing protein [Chloroflexi bacterium]|nr:DUF4230 domain-containing protein [Chloroflexota bacterium]